MQGFTMIDLVILVVYLAAVLLAGLHFAKKEMKGKEYFKGDGTDFSGRHIVRHKSQKMRDARCGSRDGTGFWVPSLCGRGRAFSTPE